MQKRADELIKIINDAMAELNELAKQPGVENISFYTPDGHCYIRCLEKDMEDDWKDYTPDYQAVVGRWIVADFEVIP